MTRSFFSKTRSSSLREAEESQNSPAQSTSATSRPSFNSHRDNEQQYGGLSPRKPWHSVTSVFGNMFPKNKTNKRESSGTFHASSQSQPKNEDKKTAGTKAKENAVVEHRVQEKPDLIIRSMLESPDTQRTLSRDDTELTTVTSNHPSLGTGTVHTPGDSPVTEAEDEDMAQTGGLGDLIFDNMKDSKLTSGQFLPEGLLDRFLTEKSVRRELTKNNISPDDVDDLVAFAVHRAPKIFATLLQADYQGDRLLTAMQYFRKYAIGDEFLPITEENRSRVPFLVNQEWLWTKRAEKIFCEKQWAFRAAELPPRSADEMILKLDANAILPFVKAERSDSGAFGDVYRVLPSESNIRLAKLKGREMAVKYLKDQYPKGDRARLKQYDDWTREVETHHKIKHLGHPHIVEFIAAIERGEERYLVFLWADQGNLLSFWTNHPSPRISVTLVEAVVRQIQGLSEALDKLHNYNKEPGAGAESSVRHGDLKPENILSQSTQGRQPSAHEPDIGTLMIADLGLAKLHAVGTNVRDRTSTRATTWRYQPPEVETLKQKGRSRRYDIWSMGCVILEFVIWLRYGNEALRVFNANIVRVTRPGVVINIENGTESPWFEVLHDHDQTQKAQLHPIVEQTMNFMLENDPEFKGDTALRDIFHLVRDRLLVVELGQSNSQERTGAGTGSNSPTTSMTSIQSTSHVEGGTPFAQTSWNEQVIDPPEKDLPVPGISIVIDGVEELRMLRSEQPYSQSSHNTRAKSEELNATLLEILEKGRNNRGYWYSGTPDVMLDMNKIREAAGISSPSGFLSPDAARNAGGRGLAAQSAQARENEYRNAAELDRTDYIIDNSFALKAISNMDSEGLFPEPSNRARLCTRCRKLDFFVPDFLVEDTWADLKETHNVCDFCALRWQVCIEQNLKNTQKITFVAINSMLHLNEHADPVMSICRAPGDQVFESKQESKRIKIGFPNLTASCSQHMGLMRQWLEYCDTRHHCKPQANSSVPTRVIDIGTEHEPTVRLCETKPGDSFRYIALSHCWGTEQHFLTTACNLEEHKRGIPIQTLPRTFQHAIQTTRQLGIQYLWIDSICIIQGDHGDFDKEAEKMELVFSSAYCVLAASSARSQQDGFLNPRKARKAVNLVKEGDARGGVYVSLFSDDFKEHVVNSPLSERGWVLQERALARRTIYFTEWQTYWECGDGIRCETLTLMNNNLISFLGDPNFPSKLSDGTSDRGEKIRFYEGLYKQYSRLTLSRDSDRPIAIAGLEKRLIHDLKSSGGFGVFDDERSLLPRSLLWQRGDEFPTLKKIESQVLPRVPTWSWMAYKGGVDYLDPPFGEVAWNISEIRGNWFGKGNRTELSAKTRLFRMTTTTTQDFDITWDIPKDIKPDVVRLKCIVVGVKMQRGVSAETKTHYVLIVRLREYSAGLATEETEIYERVGVGKMLGLYIDLDNSQPRDWVKIR